MNFILDNWPSLLSLSGLATLIGSVIRFGPKAMRRFALMLDCEVDRLRWEEADKLRNRELVLLRQDVTNLQADLARVLARSVGSGAASAAAPDASAIPSPPTSKPPS